jgi:hypothetical protein
MANTWNNSIFIPAIDFHVTKNQLKEFMEKIFGKDTVQRIDHVSFNSDKGSGRRAFIHLNPWTNASILADEIRHTIIMKGFYDIHMPGSTIKLRLMPNKNPVPETDVTIQQVASNMDFMAEKIHIHEDVCVRLSDQVIDLNKQVDSNMAFMAEKIRVQNEVILQLHEQIKDLKQFTENLFHLIKSNQPKEKEYVAV